MARPGGEGRCPRQRRAGYTLIELLVLVGIIGILAAIAVTTYSGYRKKARSVEARLGLHMIQVLEDSYRKEHDTYSADLNAIGFRMLGKPVYAYSVAAGTHNFTARAEANLDFDAALDVWVAYPTAEQVHLNRD